MESKSWSRLWIVLIVIMLVILTSCGVTAYFVWNGLQRIGDALSTDGTLTSLRSTTTNGQTTFDLVYGRDVTGVSTLVVNDKDDNKLWEISGQSLGKPAKIVYGVTPTEPEVTWKQEFPADGKPPADICGQRVKVVVNTRYNIPLGPGHQLAQGEFDIPK